MTARRTEVEERGRWREQALELRPSAEGADRWELPRSAAMLVPGVLYASEPMAKAVEPDALRQVANVACLPGIVGASYAMPDIHWGYGFPIGGVAATDVGAGGVVSPGGVGFDISCGVRLLVSDAQYDDIERVLPALLASLRQVIPVGAGGGGLWQAGPAQLDAILAEGAPVAVSAGLGRAADLVHCEDGGRLDGADPGQVSERARSRGAGQVGSLGSGNHFLEIQRVERIFDPLTAAVFGLAPNRVCVMIHCGSRGLGHQVCSDHVRTMRSAMATYGISVPDGQLACVPVESPEGRAYLGAMAAAANYGRANRQVLSAGVRRVFESVTGRTDLRLLYDVSHNLAKLERHPVGGADRLLCVHRKGATLALPPGHPGLPADLRPVGQPVLIPGSMGTASYVMVGAAPGGAFHSACHGAGRTMSRHAAARLVDGAALERELRQAGIRVSAGSRRGLAEEAPVAYKDIDEVVASCHRAGLARMVARLRPVAVLKG